MGNNVLVDYYQADVVTTNDYYPFGMAMPGRKHSQVNSNYRYGFNGKENDNEVKGEGGQQDYGMRIYDPRIGRFLSVDPLFKGYPWYTPYQFAGNKPINCVDLDGLEDYDVVKSIQITFGDPNLLITGVLTTAYKQRQSEALALSKSNPGRLQVLQQQSFNAVVAKISEIVSLHFDPNINNTKWTATVGEKLGGDFLQSPEISMYNSYTDYSTPGALVTAGSSIANEVEWAANFLVSNYRLDGFFNAGYYKKAIDIETDPNRKAILMEEMASQNREKTISWLSMAFIMFQPEPTFAPNLSKSASGMGRYANLSKTTVVGELIKAGNEADRGGLTIAGRSLQKHGNRTGSLFPRVKGTVEEINSQGESVLMNILTNPKVTTTTRHHAKFGDVLEYRIPDGQGA